VHPLLRPLGVVEDDQHVVVVLEQLVALLNNLFLDGDPRGDDYLFNLIEGQRLPILDGELLEGGQLEPSLDLVVQHALLAYLLPGLGESDYLLAHGEVWLAQADVDVEHQAVVHLLRGPLFYII
jgi:hypothetical protein